MKSYYERAKSLSRYWKNRANDFYAAAMVINEARSTTSTKTIKEKLGRGYNLDVALSPVFGFICATRLELNLKACLIEKWFKEQIINMLQATGKKRITDEEVYLALDKRFFTHDWCDLANKINLKWCGKEKNFLKLLTQQIGWEGRYPIPKDKGVLERYVDFFNAVMFEQKKETPSVFSKFDAEMMINGDNFERMWLKVENFYTDLVA